MSNWWVNSSPSQGSPGGTTVGGGGYGAEAGAYRNAMDQQRSAQGPTAQYPDGYLGTITDRREDRMYGALQKKLTSKSYQRGVHKGERLGQDSYYWNDEMSPDQGLERQMATTNLVDDEGGLVMQTQRFAPSGNPVERLTALGNAAGLSSHELDRMAKQYGVDPAKNPMPMMQTNPSRAARMANMMPRWSGVNQA